VGIRGSREVGKWGLLRAWGWIPAFPRGHEGRRGNDVFWLRVGVDARLGGSDGRRGGADAGVDEGPGKGLAGGAVSEEFWQ